MAAITDDSKRQPDERDASGARGGAGMTLAEDRRRYEAARDAGRTARRGGVKRDRCPYTAPTLRDLREAWELGWLAEDSERRRK